MASLLEMTKDMVVAQATTAPMTTEELIVTMSDIYNALKAMERGEVVASAPGAAEVADEDQPAVSKRKAFGKDKVYCMICGEGFTTLKRHLTAAHDMSPKEYRQKFDIPSKQKLAAKNYSEARRQMAIDLKLADGLAKGRAAKAKKKWVVSRICG